MNTSSCFVVAMHILTALALALRQFSRWCPLTNKETTF